MLPPIARATLFAIVSAIGWRPRLARGFAVVLFRKFLTGQIAFYIGCENRHAHP
jgi:hypothetical protein